MKKAFILTAAVWALLAVSNTGAQQESSASGATIIYTMPAGESAVEVMLPCRIEMIPRPAPPNSPTIQQTRQPIFLNLIGVGVPVPSPEIRSH